VGKHIVGALAQGVEEQDPALPDISLVREDVGGCSEAARLVDLLGRRNIEWRLALSVINAVSVQ